MILSDDVCYCKSHDHLVGVLRSKTVPATEAIEPVGINLSETGVKLKVKDEEICRRGKRSRKEMCHLFAAIRMT